MIDNQKTITTLPYWRVKIGNLYQRRRITPSLEEEDIFLQNNTNNLSDILLNQGGP